MIILFEEYQYKTEKLEQKTQKNEKQMNITKSDIKCFVS